MSSCDDLKKKVGLYKINAIYFGQPSGPLFEKFEDAS